MRYLRVLIAVVLFGLAFVSPVLAAYSYRASLTVAESNGTSYTMLPLIASVNNTFLAANGYMSATGLDTRVQTLGGVNKPHMVADNKTLFAVPVGANSQTNLYYTTGDTPLSDMDIVLGYGGYFTVADNAALELSDNFSISCNDTRIDSLVYDDVVSKQSAIKLFSDDNLLIAGIYSTDTGPSNTSTSTGEAIINSAGFYNAVGQYIANLPVCEFESVTFYLQKTNSPTGLIYFRMYDTSNNIITTFGSFDVSTISAASQQPYTINTSFYNDTVRNVYIVAEYTGTTSNYVRLSDTSPSSTSGEWGARLYPSSWTHNSGKDSSCVIVYHSYAKQVSYPITSGEYDIEMLADSSNLTLMIDGISVNSTALSGTAVPNNSNSYIFGSNTVPYFGSVNISINGITQATYQPNSIIIGTTLPNNANIGHYNGVITWGSNPAGVAVSLGGLVSAGQPEVGSTGTSPSRDQLPGIGGPDVSSSSTLPAALLTNPLRPFVTIMSDTTTITELQAWRYFGLMFVLIVLITAVALVPRHLVIAGGCTAAAVIALVVMQIWPMYALILAVLLIFGGWVSERSPSL